MHAMDQRLSVRSRSPQKPVATSPLRKVLAGVAAVYASIIVLGALGVPLPLRIVHRDSLEYIRLASNLAEHGVLGFEAQQPSARREFLYPFFLALFMKVGLVRPFDFTPGNFWPVLLVQAGLYVAALGMVAERARRLVPDAVARTTVVLGAAYFPVAKFAFQILSEALTVALLSALFFLLARRESPTERPRLALAGLTLGLLGVLKSVMLPAIPLVAAFLVRARRATLLLGVSFTVIALIAPAGWLFRNQVQFDRFIPSTTDGSSALYRGNMMLGHQPSGFGDPAIPEEVRVERARLGPAADAYLSRLTRQRLLESPGEYGLHLVYKLFVLWVGDPRSSDGPVTFVLRSSMAILIASQLALFLRRRDPDSRLVLWFALYLTVIYTLLLTTPRYFVPATFLLLPLAASALHRVRALLTRKPAQGAFTTT